MATSQQALVRDASTLANYKQWGTAISAFFTTAGWTQTSDTGQVNWGTIATVPANSITRDYEIWTPGDGLQPFYVKVQYGTGSASASTSPALAMSIGDSTNGAGVLTGFVTVIFTPTTSPGVTSTVTKWQCYFSGDSGRIAMMLWRDDTGGNNGQLFFAVQRSLNSSGAPYGTSSTGYVTLLMCGRCNSCQCGQQSLLFGQGVSNQVFPNISAGGFIVLFSTSAGANGGNTDLFNGAIPISPVFPDIGFFDTPMDIAAVGHLEAFSEGGIYLIPAAQMPYGVAHTYVVGTLGSFASAAGNWTGASGHSALLMRFD